ncbi:hypothetical protein [Rubritalea tangerina]
MRLIMVVVRVKQVGIGNLHKHCLVWIQKNVREICLRFWSWGSLASEA